MKCSVGARYGVGDQNYSFSKQGRGNPFAFFFLLPTAKPGVHLRNSLTCLLLLIANQIPLPFSPSFFFSMCLLHHPIYILLVVEEIAFCFPYMINHLLEINIVFLFSFCGAFSNLKHGIQCHSKLAPNCGKWNTK